MNKIKLAYGLNPAGDMVLVEDVPKGGKTDLVCPFCNAPLTAKKGNTKEHHFAHQDGYDCIISSQQEYDQSTVFGVDRYFTKHVSLEMLNAFMEADEIYFDHPHRRKMELAKLITHNMLGQADKPMVLTKLGLAFKGMMRLTDFQEYQRREFTDPALNTVSDLYRYWLGDPPQDVVDLLTRQWDIQQRFLRHWLGADLYFLYINVDDDQYLYKIGMTTQAIESRISQIAGDLRSHFGHEVESIEALIVLRGQALLERYFLRHFSNFRINLGSHREYLFGDSDLRDAALAELEDLGNREYTETELLVKDCSGADIWDTIQAGKSLLGITVSLESKLVYTPKNLFR